MDVSTTRRRARDKLKRNAKFTLAVINSDTALIINNVVPIRFGHSGLNTCATITVRRSGPIHYFEAKQLYDFRQRLQQQRKSRHG